MATNKPNLVYYTDGSCGSKDRIGGWGFARFLDLNHIPMKGLARLRPAGLLEISNKSAGYNDTTISRMELSAAIAAMIDAMECKAWQSWDKRQIVITTDSEYVQKGYTENLDTWIRRGGRKSNGEPVVNFDLWLVAKHLKDASRAKIVWTRGHAGNVGNERADKLAGEQRQAILAQARATTVAGPLRSGWHEWLQVNLDKLDHLRESVPRKSLF